MQSTHHLSHEVEPTISVMRSNPPFQHIVKPTTSVVRSNPSSQSPSQTYHHSHQDKPTISITESNSPSQSQTHHVSHQANHYQSHYFIQPNVLAEKLSRYQIQSLCHESIPSTTRLLFQPPHPPSQSIVGFTTYFAA